LPRAGRSSRRRAPPSEEAAKALAETGERLKRPGPGDVIDAPVARETRAQANGISQAVEKVDLIVDDPAYLQVEAVGSQVERGQRLLFHDFSAILVELETTLS